MSMAAAATTTKKRIVEFIGRKGTWKGRSLTEHALMLKNKGVGRMFILGSEERSYPAEVSYYVLVKSEPSTDPHSKSSYFEAMRVFRSEQIAQNEPVYVHKRKDWHLVRVEDEHLFKSRRLANGLKRVKPTSELDKFVHAPPIIGLLLLRQEQLKKQKIGEKASVSMIKIPIQLQSDYVKLKDDDLEDE